MTINNNKSAFEKQPDDEKINLTLAILTQRKIDAGHSIRFKKKYFKLLDSNGHPVYYTKITTCTVIQAFDGSLFTCIRDKVYALEEIPKHEHISKYFDVPKTTSKSRKTYIPPMCHLWKQDAFESHLKKQKHRSDISFLDVANTQAIVY